MGFILDKFSGKGTQTITIHPDSQNTGTSPVNKNLQIQVNGVTKAVVQLIHHTPLQVTVYCVNSSSSINGDGESLTIDYYVTIKGDLVIQKLGTEDVVLKVLDTTTVEYTVQKDEDTSINIAYFTIAANYSGETRYLSIQASYTYEGVEYTSEVVTMPQASNASVITKTTRYISAGASWGTIYNGDGYDCIIPAEAGTYTPSVTCIITSYYTWSDGSVTTEELDSRFDDFDFTIRYYVVEGSDFASIDKTTGKLTVTANSSDSDYRDIRIKLYASYTDSDGNTVTQNTDDDDTSSMINSAVVRQQLSEIVDTSYTWKSASLSYDSTVSVNGGTLTPTVDYEIIVTYTWSDGSTTSQYFLVGTIGESTVYAITAGASYAAIDPGTGVLTIDPNTSASERTITVRLDISVDGVDGSATVYAQVTQGALGITSVSYSWVDVNLAYDNVSVDGGTSSPTTTYTQLATYTWSDGSTTTEEITSGADITYQIISSESDYVSIDSSTGVLTFESSDSTSVRTITVQATFNLNDKVQSATTEVSQEAATIAVYCSSNKTSVSSSGGTSSIFYYAVVNDTVVMDGLELKVLSTTTVSYTLGDSEELDDSLQQDYVISENFESVEKYFVVQAVFTYNGTEYTSEVVTISQPEGDDVEEYVTDEITIKAYLTSTAANGSMYNIALFYGGVELGSGYITKSDPSISFTLSAPESSDDILRAVEIRLIVYPSNDPETITYNLNSNNSNNTFNETGSLYVNGTQENIDYSDYTVVMGSIYVWEVGTIDCYLTASYT